MQRSERFGQVEVIGYRKPPKEPKTNDQRLADFRVKLALTARVGFNTFFHARLNRAH